MKQIRIGKTVKSIFFDQNHVLEKDSHGQWRLYKTYVEDGRVVKRRLPGWKNNLCNLIGKKLERNHDQKTI